MVHVWPTKIILGYKEFNEILIAKCNTITAKSAAEAYWQWHSVLVISSGLTRLFFFRQCQSQEGNIPKNLNF